MASYYFRPRSLEYAELLDPPSIIAPSSGPQRNPKPRRFSSIPPYIHPKHIGSRRSSPVSNGRIAVDSSDSSSDEGTPPPEASVPTRIRFVGRKPLTKVPSSVRRPSTQTDGGERVRAPSVDKSESEYSLNVPEWSRDSADGPHEGAVDESGVDWDSLPKIPKPEGEAGRPKRGGYNLEEKLGWDNTLLAQVKGFVKSQVVSKLACSVPFTLQPSEKLEDVRSSAIDKFPMLKRYEDCWAVDDLIRCNLKYQKQKIAKEHNETLASKYRATDEAREERRALEEQPETSSRRRRQIV
ncbi:hypothetical protein V5O48_018615 [Marasmius crinis-equi]|uniref:Uncharacterized protein n=1 Tax=Marasmius crinis-equi TaxID=585013 RepID=A0ABR3EKN9_9AGAR